MSQVIVTKDVFEEQRKRSREQEKQIDTSIMADHKMSDPTKKDPVAMVVGIAALPVLAAWSGICAVVFLVMSVFRFLMRGVGSVWRGTHLDS